MADNLLDIEIVTPDKILYTGKARSVSVPGSKSPFQILYNHAPIVSSLDPGLVKIVDDNQNDLWFATSSGFAEVLKNQISILVESADKSDDIDINAVNSEMEEARNLLKETKDQIEIDELKLRILQAQFKIKAAEKKD